MILFGKKKYGYISEGILKRPQKFGKNHPLVLTLMSKNNCFFKTDGRFFLILWPSHNVSTLPMRQTFVTKKDKKFEVTNLIISWQEKPKTPSTI